MKGHAVLCALALAATSAAAQAETHVVTIEDMAFKPAVVTVKPGDTVEWQNKDVVPHTVTAAGQFDSRQIPAGKRWTWTAGAKGHRAYVCAYHPGMQGSVVVE